MSVSHLDQVFVMKAWRPIYHSYIWTHTSVVWEDRLLSILWRSYLLQTQRLLLVRLVLGLIWALSGAHFMLCVLRTCWWFLYFVLLSARPQKRMLCMSIYRSSNNQSRICRKLIDILENHRTRSLILRRPILIVLYALIYCGSINITTLWFVNLDQTRQLVWSILLYLLIPQSLLVVNHVLVYGKHIVIVHWMIRPRLRVCGQSLPVAADVSIYVVDTASYEVTHCIRAERVVHLHALADMIVLAFKHRQLILKVKILALFVDFYFSGRHLLG